MAVALYQYVINKKSCVTVERKKISAVLQESRILIAGNYTYQFVGK